MLNKSYAWILLVAVSGVSAGVQAQPAATGAAAAYPSRPIRLLSGFAPGGATDIAARVVAQKLTQSLGQPMVVENRPGAAGNIAAEMVARGAPDGHLMYLANATIATPSLFTRVPFEVTRDFAFVSMIGLGPSGLVVHPSLPVRSMKELIALAKSRPGQLNYASSAVGGALHLAAELLNIMVGTKMQHIPYKGSSQLMPDLIAGQIHLSFQSMIGSIPFINSKRVKALGITSTTRSPALPNVPTFAEGGLPKYELAAWYGILLPAGTSKEITARLSAEMAKILALPGVRKELATQGLEPFTSSPEQFTAMIKADLDKFARIIKTANIRYEQ